MSCKTKFDDKLIDQFLSFCFCDHSIFKISFNINIKECRSTSKGSCSHFFHFRKGTDLLRNFFTQTDAVFCHRSIFKV